MYKIITNHEFQLSLPNYIIASQVNLDDEVKWLKASSCGDGWITMISHNGINVTNEHITIFIKWRHVKEIKKKPIGIDLNRIK